MADPVTIDNYDMAAHKRWVKDQAEFDPFFIYESGEIPAHLDTATLEKSLLSKWEQLFELGPQHHPFAHFAPPPKYAFMRNRFFTYAISEHLSWAKGEDEAEDDDDEKEKRREDEQYAQQLKKKITQVPAGSMPHQLFEKERKALLKMIDSIHHLNVLMQSIHARKLQYQKG